MAAELVHAVSYCAFYTCFLELLDAKVTPSQRVNTGLANLSGAIFKKYSVECAGLLQYVANQLKAGKRYADSGFSQYYIVH